MLRCLRPIALIILAFPTILRAQTIGVEAGYMRDIQEGHIIGNCGCDFDRAEGNGFSSAFSTEASLGLGFFGGVRVGYESQSIAASRSITETGVFQNAEGSTDTAAISMTRTLDVTLGYLSAMPFVEYKIP